jgi:hypothetical protein
MSGGVPPSSRAGRRLSVPPRHARSVKASARLFERFTGHDAAEAIEIPDLKLPDSVAVIGECDGVLYTTVRDGNTEQYIHEFKSKDKPLLCVSPDGRQLLLIGGAYIFTDRGIVDGSDSRNLPRSLRGRIR